MISLINRTRIKDWKYSTVKGTGRYLGLDWLYIGTEGDNEYHNYEVSKNGRSCYIRIHAVGNPDIKYVIEAEIELLYERLVNIIEMK